MLQPPGTLKVDDAAAREAFAEQPEGDDLDAEETEDESGRERDALSPAPVDDGVEGELDAEVDEDGAPPTQAPMSEAAQPPEEQQHDEAALAARIEEAGTAGRRADSQAEQALPPQPQTEQYDEDEYADEEEEEPSLKYSRLRNGVAEVLAKDTASAMIVSDRVVVSDKQRIQAG